MCYDVVSRGQTSLTFTLYFKMGICVMQLRATSINEVLMEMHIKPFDLHSAPTMLW